MFPFSFDQFLSFFPFVITGMCIGGVSGLFGTGGGFLLTPLLLTMGYSSTMAVATSTSFVAITSFFSLITHVFRKTLIYRLGIIMTIGGLVGLGIGWNLFNFLRQNGLLDTVVLYTYISFLFSIGLWLMVKTLKQGSSSSCQHHLDKNQHPRPSSIALTSFGSLGGILSSLLGIGGGIFLVPLLIEGLSLPILVGMAIVQLQTFLIASINAFLHFNAGEDMNIPMILCLGAGGVLGAQLGHRLIEYFKPFTLKIMLACLILLTSGQLLFYSLFK